MLFSYSRHILTTMPGVIGATSLCVLQRKFSAKNSLRDTLGLGTHPVCV